VDGGGLTSHGSAVQYNVTRQCGSLNEHLPETWTLLPWSTLRLFKHLPALLPVLPNRPSHPPNKEIFEYIQAYSNIFEVFLKIFREYVQYIQFIPDIMDKTTRSPAC
jgi:hypothetical protein